MTTKTNLNTENSAFLSRIINFFNNNHLYIPRILLNKNVDEDNAIQDLFDRLANEDTAEDEAHEIESTLLEYVPELIDKLSVQEKSNTQANYKSFIDKLSNTIPEFGKSTLLKNVFFKFYEKTSTPVNKLDELNQLIQKTNIFNIKNNISKIDSISGELDIVLMGLDLQNLYKNFNDTVKDIYNQFYNQVDIPDFEYSSSSSSSSRSHSPSSFSARFTASREKSDHNSIGGNYK